ncbi:hypothetical protein Y032_0465g1952 [Ancylostoma ceylanicum]|nr:hypothetical protein Y032_0465g1952 [Ancylostoma ceylanicum]
MQCMRWNSFRDIAHQKRCAAKILDSTKAGLVRIPPFQDFGSRLTQGKRDFVEGEGVCGRCRWILGSIVVWNSYRF